MTLGLALPTLGKTSAIQILQFAPAVFGSIHDIYIARGYFQSSSGFIEMGGQTDFHVITHSFPGPETIYDIYIWLGSTLQRMHSPEYHAFPIIR